MAELVEASLVDFMPCQSQAAGGRLPRACSLRHHLLDGGRYFLDAVADDKTFLVRVFASVADGNGRLAVILDKKASDVVGLEDKWEVVLNV